jgi:hypothetical protein
LDVRITSGGTWALDGADLGDGHLVVGQHLQQQRLEGFFALVDLVDQQHAAAWSCSIACSSGRGCRKSRLKNRSWKPGQLAERASSVSLSPIRWPIFSFRIWVYSSCLPYFHSYSALLSSSPS